MMSIQKGGLVSLNRASFDALGQPSAVALFFDREEQILAMQAVAETEPYAYMVRRQQGSDSYLVSAQKLLSYYGVPTPVTRRYQAQHYGDYLGVDLNHPLAEVQGPGRWPRASEEAGGGDGTQRK